jgi:hypothetical protein
MRFAPDRVPLADADALRPLARRTAVVRAAAAVALLALVALAILAGRHPHVHELRLLPDRSNGIVVLDLSASISSDTYSRIGATLADLAATRGRYGVIVFSDTAYEALPPGTPAAALQPLVRYFRLPPQKRPGIAPTFPVNPWANAFTAGTRISTGLDLARSVIIGAHLPRPAVLLVSDLDDDPADLPQLNRIGLAYQQEGIPLHVIALNPSPEDERYFRRLVSGRGSFAQAHLPRAQPAASTGAAFPRWLAGAALALALLLAANELWCARLTWGGRASVRGGPP